MGLPGKYRVPLCLYYSEGYAAAEVGAILGLTVNFNEDPYWREDGTPIPGDGSHQFAFSFLKEGKNLLGLEAVIVTSEFVFEENPEAKQEDAQMGETVPGKERDPRAVLLWDNVLYQLSIEEYAGLAALEEGEASELLKTILDAYE